MNAWEWAGGFLEPAASKSLPFKNRSMDSATRLRGHGVNHGHRAGRIVAARKNAGMEVWPVTGSA